MAVRLVNTNEILVSKDKYPYLEMARVGKTRSNIDIIVRTDDPGKIPHFHFVDLDRKGLNEGCIRIDKPEYFSHGYKTATLNSKQIKDLIDFLTSIRKNARHNETYWERLVDIWNDNNSDVIIDVNTPMPDYTLLNQP